MLEVVHLAKQIENPRTKCWKVVVPYKFKEMMEKDKMYPTGWCHRKFFAPRRSDHVTKQPRREDSIVQDVIKEQQRKLEAEKQQVEDRRQAGQMLDDVNEQPAASVQMNGTTD